MEDDDAKIYEILSSMDVPDEQYLSAFIKQKKAEALEVLNQGDTLEAEEKTQKQDAALNGFFTTLSFVEHLSEPIEYEPVIVGQI